MVNTGRISAAEEKDEMENEIGKKPSEREILPVFKLVANYKGETGKERIRNDCGKAMV